MSSVLCLNSCESEDEIEYVTDPVEQKILLSKVTTVYYDNPANPQTIVSNLTYSNQGDLSKIVSEGRTSIFEYDTAGKPSKINYYNSAGILEYYLLFSYVNNELQNIKAIYSNPDFNRTTTYTYNNGKVVTSTQCQSANCSNQSISSYTYNEENITVETSETASTISSSKKREYLYDNQLSPFTFTNKYVRIMMGGAYPLSKNNYASERISSKDSSGNWVQDQQVTYEILYNSAQLPTQVFGKTASGANYVKYNYEYIIQ